MSNNPGQGRKPKPTHLKLLDGEPNKCRINLDEPKPYPKAPKCPAWLSKEARAEWRRLAPRLEILGILTEIDLAAFASYCAAFGKLIWAEKQMKRVRKIEGKTGNSGGMIITIRPGVYQTSPYIWIYNKALEQIRSFGSEFGLSPSSRTRIKIDKPEAAGDDFD